MIASCNDLTQPFAKTICSICYEDLKPIVEDLQAISICGHVFHELCIQQWFEYCSKGKKKCPICKQTCSSCNVSRLYFQSVGDSSDPNLSQKLQTDKQNPEELQLECRRLEGKVKGLSSALESREKDLKNISNELCEYKKQSKMEEASKNEALKEKLTISRLLTLKTQELNKSDLERIKLQERNDALTKEFAAYKLAFDYNLDENEIVKLTSIVTQDHSKESVDIFRNLLDYRIKIYNDLLAKQRISEGNANHLHAKLEKAKKRIRALKTADEEKDNIALRDQKTSKKTVSVLNVVDNTRSDMCTPQVTVKEPSVHLRKAKRSRGSENNDESNDKNGVSSYILIDDDVPDISVSPEFSSHDSVFQPTNMATTDSSWLPKTVRETSKHKAVPMSNFIDEDAILVPEIAQDMPLPNITKLNPSAVLNSKEGDFCFSAGLIAPDGTKRHLGKWCKKAQSKGFSSSSVPRQVSGDLISVGADGRGGTIKVLKSQSQSSLDSKRSSVSAKNGKFGAKTSTLQSHGSLQINHFFSKASQ